MTEMELQKKAAAYETLISKSMSDPWSPEQLKIENAYRFYKHLQKDGKEELSAKQFEFLKKHLARTIFKFSRRASIPIKKLRLAALMHGVETATSINEIDWIIEQALKNIGRHPQKECI